MTKQKKEIYKCNICGNVVEVLYVGGGELVCCGQPMELLKEKTKEEGMEKHLPVIEKMDRGVRVRIGSALHPMTDEHYIEWIEILVGEKSCRKFLKPGDKPEADFETKEEINGAREYCNIHGLWKSQ